MRLYHDDDADLALLQERAIAVIGYGNQGRAQALNLRDSGLNVIVGNRSDEYAARAKADRFAVHSIATAVSLAGIVMLLIPDEIMAEVFEAEIAPKLSQKSVVVFASGYNVGFGRISPPPDTDVVLLAPRMVGAGVRDLYVSGKGFPAFIGIAQDYSGQARAFALALARGIGATRAGVAEVTFRQEAELDLFTEQCFGPAFGSVLMSSIDLLLDAGYPPEAVLLELYMSGELAYTLGKIAEMGMVEQTALHSTTSQYGSMSRGLRFQLPELRERLRDGLHDIRSGSFALEWAAEQAEGSPTLAMLRQAAADMPLHVLETELRQALHTGEEGALQAIAVEAQPQTRGYVRRRQLIAKLKGLVGRLGGRPATSSPSAPSAPPTHTVAGASLPAQATPESTQPETPAIDLLRRTIAAFIESARTDPALQAFATNRAIRSAYRLRDLDITIRLDFVEGVVSGGTDLPLNPVDVELSMDAATFDGIMSGRLNATRTALNGAITFSGETPTALTLQRIQKDLIRIYTRARAASG